MEVKFMFRNILQSVAKDSDITFSDNQLDQFADFYQMIVEWNKKINLTTITDPYEFAVKHIIDSILIWNENKIGKVETIIDVGTGAGFPCIPLKILNPYIKITLLDSLGKRISFLEDVVTKIGLQDVLCLHGRAEDAAHNPRFREKFDLAVSRAVAQLNILSEYCLPFVKTGGYFAALKSSKIDYELNDAEYAIKLLGGGNIETIDVKLPNGDGRKLIYIKKIVRTPNQFPRKAGLPKKTPLIKKNK